MAGPDAHYYRPADGSGLPHDPLTAIVGPRPIGWISTQSPEGVNNLAPYSFFNLLNYWPPLIAFSSIGWKDTVANIDATGEFVAEPLDTWLVIGEVIAVHIDRHLVEGGAYDTGAAHPLLRAGSLSDYAEVRPENMFVMDRPDFRVGLRVGALL